MNSQARLMPRAAADTGARAATFHAPPHSLAETSVTVPFHRQGHRGSEHPHTCSFNHLPPCFQVISTLA